MAAFKKLKTEKLNQLAQVDIQHRKAISDKKSKMISLKGEKKTEVDMNVVKANYGTAYAAYVEDKAHRYAYIRSTSWNLIVSMQ